MEAQTLFLKKFVREIIDLSTPLEIKLKEERKNLRNFKPLPKPEPKLKPVFKRRYRLKPVRISQKFTEEMGGTKKTREKISGIHPVPSNQKIDLRKLNPLIYDPKVQVIECPGPNRNVLVRIGNTKVTKITLTKDEIDSIINKFSKESKIPVMPGVFKAAVGNLIITAVISEHVGSRFIINKMTPQYIAKKKLKQMSNQNINRNANKKIVKK